MNNPLVSLCLPTVLRSEIDFTKVRPLRAHETVEPGDLQCLNYRHSRYARLTAEWISFLSQFPQAPLRPGIMGAGWFYLRPL